MYSIESGSVTDQDIENQDDIVCKKGEEGVDKQSVQKVY